MISGAEVVPEHILVPKLKMIDFGEAGEIQDAPRAIEKNLSDIAQEMMQLIKRRGLRYTTQYWEEYNGIATHAVDILPQNGIDPFPNLDPDLRNLLVQALRSDVENRPSLRQMLHRTREGAAKPASTYRRRALDESDYSIQLTFQQLLYDAP